MRKYHRSWMWSEEDFQSAWEAAEKRCGELAQYLKVKQGLQELAIAKKDKQIKLLEDIMEVHEAQIDEKDYQIDKLNAMLRLFDDC